MTVQCPEPAPVRAVIVIPVFRHSVLVSEAIGAALAQRAPFGIAVVVVDDGCPYAETQAALADHALADPGRVTVLRQANAGLSAARNRGIGHALERWPGLEAIQFLDADNRLRADALARAMAVLEMGADWVYPAIDMFGLTWAGDYGGPFSRLGMAQVNPCEAGSLVHRRVFEAGIRFDPEMRLGFEDWDFFLSAAGAGFAGRNLPEMGLRYSKRAESMLTDSQRDEAEILGALRRRHRWLRDPRALIALEQAEAPRHAIYLADRHVWRLTSDPAQPGESLMPDEFARRFWAARLAPGRHHLPAFLSATTAAALDRLRRAGMLHGALLRLEGALGTAKIAHARLSEVPDAAALLPLQDAAGAHLAADLLMMSPGCLDAVMRDPMTDWIDTLARQDCGPALAGFEIRLPAPETAPPPGIGGGSAVHALLAQLHGLRRAPWAAAAAQRWDWRSPGIPDRSARRAAVRAPHGGHPALPRLRAPGERHIGFALPLMSFGGAETVAVNTALALRARGWTPHLVVLESDEAALSHAARAAFDSVSFLGDPGQAAWDGIAAYCGTDIPPRGREGGQGALTGLMGWMDAVVNAHGAAMNGAMAALRRMGVTTVAALHLTDRTRWGRPVGHPYLALAHEHAYDLVTTCSQDLAYWCHGMGVPLDKIVPVPNAPGYDSPAGRIGAAMAARGRRGADTPLRVLFLGRLDAQKGLDALLATLRQTRAAPGRVDWRVVGRPVLDAAGALPQGLEALLEPPVSAPDDLDALYAWADVLFLPSAYEGLPLTVLEAMRLGAVPLASDVGAVSEAVADGLSGVLLPPGPALADQAARTLLVLAEDRPRLRALSAAAATAMRGRCWEDAVAPLARALEARLTQERAA